MKNFFKVIIGRIKSDYTPGSPHPLLNQLAESASNENELAENTSNLTFICPGCGFHLQLSGTPFVEATNTSKPTKTPGHLTTNQISVLDEGPLNIAPHPHHVILPPTTDQAITFKEALNTVPYLPSTNPQSDTQFSSIKMSNRSQFKFPIHRWEHLTLPGHPVSPVSSEHARSSDEEACAIAFFIG